VLLRPLGNVLYFMPPYVIEAQEIDLLVDVAGNALQRAVA
jgi:adenosylmethionine-8-amino-7-oxononanoate aminotransferase